MKTVGLIILGFLFLPAGHCAFVNNGQDITHPIPRFDNRLKYQQGSGFNQGKDVIYTARVDTVYTFDNEWVFSARIDLPYEWFYCPNNAHQCNLTYCYKSQCMGDSFIQMMMITPDMDYWTFGAGIKVVLPSAGDNLEIGEGRHQLLPSIACSCDLSEWISGSYSGIILRHAIDMGGYVSATSISQTFIQPYININLPQGWFLNSSPEIIYNWESSYWFIPFDLMLGYMITDNIIVSIEYENGIVQDYPQYAQEIEFRIGVFF